MPVTPLALGSVYGRLTVEEWAGFKYDHALAYRCRCVCGNTSIVAATLLRTGRVKSCGCWNREVAANRVRQLSTTHGYHGTPTYNSWRAMLRRCTDTENPNYGGRAIRVAREWRDAFQAFLRDMGPRPSLDHSIDRINNDGHYEPGNCRWATASEQQRNRRPYIRRRKGTMKACVHCSHVFYVFPWNQNTRQYCSKSCAGKAHPERAARARAAKGHR